MPPKRKTNPVKATAEAAEPKKPKARAATPTTARRGKRKPVFASDDEAEVEAEPEASAKKSGKRLATKKISEGEDTNASIPEPTKGRASSRGRRSSSGIGKVAAGPFSADSPGQSPGPVAGTAKRSPAKSPAGKTFLTWDPVSKSTVKHYAFNSTSKQSVSASSTASAADRSSPGPPVKSTGRAARSSTPAKSRTKNTTTPTKSVFNDAPSSSSTPAAQAAPSSLKDDDNGRLTPAHDPLGHMTEEPSPAETARESASVAVIDSPILGYVGGSLAFNLGVAILFFSKGMFSDKPLQYFLQLDALSTIHYQGIDMTESIGTKASFLAGVALVVIGIAVLLQTLQIHAYGTTCTSCEETLGEGADDGMVGDAATLDEPAEAPAQEAERKSTPRLEKKRGNANTTASQNNTTSPDVSVPVRDSASASSDTVSESPTALSRLHSMCDVFLSHLFCGTHFMYVYITEHPTTMLAVTGALAAIAAGMYVYPTVYSMAVAAHAMGLTPMRFLVLSSVSAVGGLVLSVHFRRKAVDTKCVEYVAQVILRELRDVHAGREYPVDFLEEEVPELLSDIASVCAHTNAASPEGAPIGTPAKASPGGAAFMSPGGSARGVQLSADIPAELMGDVGTRRVKRLWPEIQKAVSKDKRVQVGIVMYQGARMRCWRRLDCLERPERGGGTPGRRLSSLSAGAPTPTTATATARATAVGGAYASTGTSL